MQEIEKLNAASRGPESQRAKYGLTKLSDMSKAEFKEIHLSDEKPRHKRLKDNWVKYENSIESENHHKLQKFIRRKRATLPLIVDW